MFFRVNACGPFRTVVTHRALVLLTFRRFGTPQAVVTLFASVGVLLLRNGIETAERTAWARVVELCDTSRPLTTSKPFRTRRTSVQVLHRLHTANASRRTRIALRDGRQAG